MAFDKVYSYSLEVNFEDIDAGGVVFHPNYLNYLERARSAILRDAGYSFGRFMKEGFGIAVTSHYTQYLRPAMNDDKLLVLTRIMAVSSYEMKVYHEIHKKLNEEEVDMINPEERSAATAIYRCQMKLACVGLKNMKALKFPDALLDTLNITTEDMRTDFQKMVAIKI